MNSNAMLTLWIAAHAAQAICAGFAWAQPAGQRRPATLIVSIACSLPSIVGLAAFLMVFVFGRSSNVAQLAGSGGGADLWSLWFDAFPILIVTNLLATPALVALALVPPYPRRWWASTAARVLAAIGGACAVMQILQHFPDA